MIQITGYVKSCFYSNKSIDLIFAEIFAFLNDNFLAGSIKLGSDVR